MLDRLLGNPTIVVIAGTLIIALAALWHRHDSQHDRIARVRRGEQIDPWDE
jgi:hypothetical protein